ncbi:putative membrane protein [Nocardioides sp. J9]|uniref:FUSC family protein n=1 Tax=Nocardioides sp. J9 TaxID=935844 RepID=UPI0011A600AF|nr:FUSC family protein [Nocardioides sp. J9]TWG94200.1 putative membrane protein [Nocardioides sp. J9]
MSARPPASPSAARVPATLSVAPVLRVARLPHHPWHKPALSVLVAGLVPALVLAAFDRLDLTACALSGSLVAVYCHAVPYRRRALLHLRLVAAWTAGVAVSLAAAASTTSVVAHIVVVAVLAAVTKVVGEASTVGPPGPMLPIFVFSGLTFSPEQWGQVPGHLGLAAGSALVGWLVVMAPGVVRPYGPERRAVAVALDAAAAYVDAPDAATRGALVTAVRDAAHCLAAPGAHHPIRRALAAHLAAAERVLVDPAAVAAERLRADAVLIKGRNGELPPPAVPTAPPHVPAVTRPVAPTFATRHPVLAALRPGSRYTPYLLRVLVGCLAAASLSHLLGVGRPYWAVVTAAAIMLPDRTLTWQRAPARAGGTALGVLLFVALAPLAHRDPLVMVALVLTLNAVVELVIPRSYLLGQVLVTPMALLITEFGHVHPAGELVSDRLLDTLLGVALGLVAAVIVPNPHLHRRVVHHVGALEDAAALALAAGPGSSPGQAARLRRHIYDEHAALRQAALHASGEWWSRRHDEAAATAATERAHEALVALRQDASR